MFSLLLTLLPFTLARPFERQAPLANGTSLVETTFYPQHQQTVTVTGLTYQHIGVDRYAGIPFATPPVGDLRYAHPQSPAYNATIDGTSPKPACAQAVQPDGAAFGDLIGPYGQSEDCLYLNIWKPQGIEKDDKSGGIPVWVFIHGGGFFGGSATQDMYAPVVASIAVNKPIMIVTLPYRLGVLGWPMGQDFADAGATNVALRDLMMGMDWVKENICYFGGDPNKVTVGGHSAGAMSTGLLYLQTDQDWFRSAIMMSGNPSQTIVNTTNAIDPVPVNDFLTKAGCLPRTLELRLDGKNGVIECLKTLPIETILNAQLNTSANYSIYSLVSPSVDGDVVRASPYKLIEDGEFTKRPLLIGTARDEGTAFVSPYINSTEEFRSYVSSAPPRGFSNETVDEIERLYPNDPTLGAPFDTGNETYGFDPMFKRTAAVATDKTFLAPRRHLLQAVGHAGIDQTWAYRFDEPISAPFPAYLGAVHGVDPLYLFGVAYQNPNYTSAQQALGNTYMTYWVNFIHDVDPNGVDRKASNEAYWQRWSGMDPSVLKLAADNITNIPDTYRQEQTDFLNSNSDVIDTY